MTRTTAQKATDSVARQAAGADVESAIDALITDVATYLAAGSGDRAEARAAVAQRIRYRLHQAVGLPTQHGPITGRDLSLADSDYETAID